MYTTRYFSDEAKAIPEQHSHFFNNIHWLEWDNIIQYNSSGNDGENICPNKTVWNKTITHAASTRTHDRTYTDEPNCAITGFRNWNIGSFRPRVWFQCRMPVCGGWIACAMHAAAALRAVYTSESHCAVHTNRVCAGRSTRLWMETVSQSASCRASCRNNFTYLVCTILNVVNVTQLLLVPSMDFFINCELVLYAWVLLLVFAM